MNKLSYTIRPVTDDLTHEVRLIVDGSDWIGSNRLGMDPPELRSQFISNFPSTLSVGRCECGVVGCDDLIVDQARTETSVKWMCHGRKSLNFDRDAFDELIETLLHDHSWEPIERTVERLLDDLFNTRKTDDGYTFHWSSARIKPNLVTISVLRDDHQKLLEFSWDGVTIESALKRGRLFLRERFDT